LRERYKDQKSDQDTPYKSIKSVDKIIKITNVLTISSIRKRTANEITLDEEPDEYFYESEPLTILSIRNEV